jgi:hypothetical protein
MILIGPYARQAAAASWVREEQKGGRGVQRPASWLYSNGASA